MTPDTAALRALADTYVTGWYLTATDIRALCDAADEVQRMRAEVQEFRSLRVPLGAVERRTIKDLADQRDASRTAHAAEAAKFQAETLTTSFLMGRIRQSIEEFDRYALTCDRCGWRGARMVHIDGDLRELRCGHDQCLDRHTTTTGETP